MRQRARGANARLRSALVTLSQSNKYEQRTNRSASALAPAKAVRKAAEVSAIAVDDRVASRCRPPVRRVGRARVQRTHELSRQRVEVFVQPVSCRVTAFVRGIRRPLCHRSGPRPLQLNRPFISGAKSPDTARATRKPHDRGAVTYSDRSDAEEVRAAAVARFWRPSPTLPWYLPRHTRIRQNFLKFDSSAVACVGCALVSAFQRANQIDLTRSRSLSRTRRVRPIRSQQD